MENLLTTRQLQDLLKVDRITIYRMLSDGRLKGIKVGTQWRFPAGEVEKVMTRGVCLEAPEPPAVASDDFPAHCVQAIQDVFAEIGQVASIMLDPGGQPVTEMSQPCAFCKLIQSNSGGRAACQNSWKETASQTADGQEKRVYICHAGLNYTAAPITVNGQAIGFLLAGQFYAHAPELNEHNRRMRGLAQAYNIPVQTLSQVASQVPVLEEPKLSQVMKWPGQVVLTIASILLERASMLDRLRRIAEISRGGD
jgi:excisionase family DNA binding protein